MSEEKNIADLLGDIQKAFADLDNEMDYMAENCPPDVKLAVTKWVMDNLVEHAQDGGSYRYLIYDRLGFGPEAYAPLCSSGMTISNEFDLNLKPSVIKCLEANDIDGAKRVLGCCDEPGCFQIAGCGWPTKNGDYRWTCSTHYTKDNDSNV